ncbi:hypothetical protein COF75_07320 [Bacillus toyonensis]|nr:hypothetical protein COL62_02135 [Bacillus toyonensis]PHD51833.1 hypothetical protein COF75_07320 [Bacillus toyonensis]
MIKATVLTRFNHQEELYFNDKEDYRKFNLHRYLHPESRRLVHGWGRSIMVMDITRVISVEEEN